MSQVLFTVVLTVCTVSAGEKVCLEDTTAARYLTKSECTANINSTEKANNTPHDFVSVQGACRPVYSKPKPVTTKQASKPRPKQKLKTVEPVKAKSAPIAQPTELTATAELCGLRNGRKTRTCLSQAEEGFKSRSACIARAQELMKDSRLAFGYARIPPPYDPKVRCLGAVTTEAEAPEAAEPILPPEAAPPPDIEIPILKPKPFSWTPIAALIILVALLGGAIFFGRSNENAPGDSKPRAAPRNPVVGVRRSNPTARGVKK